MRDMQIWLDTIDFDAIAEGVKTGVISGITTNPSILSKTKSVRDTISKLLDIQPGPVAVQVTSTDTEKMIDEGRKIFAFSPRMLVKIPINRNGLIAIKELHRQNIPIVGTGIVFPTQALLASNHGISYIAPYFSHAEKPFELLKTIGEVLRSSSTKILVASVKELDHLIYSASQGVAAVTIKPDLFYKLVAEHPVVESFSERFLLDWNQTHGNLSIEEMLQYINKGSL